jgi:hypothetical protein
LKTSASSLPLFAGGDVEMKFSRWIALRAFEANWMHTQLLNGAGDVQNALLFGAGIVYCFRRDSS